MSKKGSISVKTNDIFPIIKKWLYSEHDIFVRELVSNACDAITKRKTFALNDNQTVPNGSVKVSVNKEAKTITIEDNGLGMTEAEVEKYIAQLAFSGAEEFVQKMKASGNTTTKDEIIGKFGLGFYSAFMVAQKVEVESLSYVAGAKATKWSCEGDTEYEFTDSLKTEVGTTITLHINEESADFLNAWKTRSTLEQYCRFMPYTIEFAEIEKDKETTWSTINETQPLWKQDPTTITDEDYKKFYRDLFPMDQEPLFWLHLNIDHPFTLQGILFFPKFNPTKPIMENGIKLFSKQVFVSDSVKSIVPEFLGLLKGAIDSTDIPLNVSRSALQGDPNVKKISNYNIKKVAESLKKLFKNDRARYETVWNDIALFVKYGCVSDTKFDELMREMVLFRNTEDKLVTLEEYKTSIPETYKEKVKDTIIFFEKDNADQGLKDQLKNVGIFAVETDNMIDNHFMQHTEMHKLNDKEYKWSSIDTEFENIFGGENLNETDTQIKDMFENILIGEKKENSDWTIEVKKVASSVAPAYLKIDQSSKRFQQMAKQMGNMGFNMPLKKTLVLNPASPLIQNAFKLWGKDDKKEIAQKICRHVQDLASFSSEGLEEKEKHQFIERAQSLMTELSSMAL